MSKKELIKLKEIETKLVSLGLKNDEINNLLKPIEKELTKRNYGIVWEKQEEDNKENLNNTYPSLDLIEIINKINEDKNHLLIEGDNLFTLASLQYTHRVIDSNTGLKNGIFNIIYIDPPYNLGFKDFKYNDRFVNEDDQYKHSKWLSFMYDRLILAKNLLADDGVIFISIDDTEYAQLKLLCDLEELFGEKNYLNTIFILDNMKGKADNFITSVGHKVLVYAKNKTRISELGGFNKIENNFGKTVAQKFKKHEDGIYNEVTFRKSGQDKERAARGSMYFPILVKESKIYKIEDYEYEQIYDSKSKTFNDIFVEEMRVKYENQGYLFILPINEKGIKVRWTSGWDGFKKLLEKDNLIFNSDTKGIVEKKFPTPTELIQEYANGVAKSFMYKPSYSNGTIDLEASLGCSCDFSYPKPVSLLKDLFSLHPNKNALILDFFAGSGTTAEAVLELNHSDKLRDSSAGNRRFVLATNNEVDFESEVRFFAKLKKLGNINIGENGEISKSLEEKFYEYKKNHSQEYKEIISSNEFNKLGICQSITLKRINNLLQKKFTNESLCYFKVNVDCANTPYLNMLIKNTLEKFVNYITIKENAFEQIPLKNNNFYCYKNSKNTIFICKNEELLDYEVKEYIEEVSETLTNTNIIVYSMAEECVLNNKVFKSYPLEIIELINRIRKELNV